MRQPTQIFDATEINKALGMKLIESSPGNATIEMDADDKFTQEKGVIHGGIISTLADTAAVYSFLPTLPENQLCGSIEFKVNFLAPATADKGKLTAKGHVIKKGTRIIVCESSVYQSDKQIAFGTFSYLVWERS